MKTIVLVHGAFATGRVWSIVKPLLEHDGYEVVAITLPGHGGDSTPFEEITLGTYVDYVVDQIKALASTVTLVGHSLAGMVISGVAEKIPDLIEQLVYLAAFLPSNGQSFAELLQTDNDSFVGRCIEYDGSSAAKINFGPLVDAIAAEHLVGLAEHILEQTKLEPVGPLTEKIVLSDANFGQVTKYYIETLHDHTLSVAMQEKMIADTNCVKQVIPLESTHVLFLVIPIELVNILKTIAGPSGVEPQPNLVLDQPAKLADTALKALDRLDQMLNGEVGPTVSGDPKL